MDVRIAALLRKLDRTHEATKRAELQRALDALGYKKQEPKKVLPVERKAPEPVTAAPAAPKETAAKPAAKPPARRGPGRPPKARE